MEPEARYTLVGTSVLILIALMTAAVVWLVASRGKTDVRDYRIYFSNQSLEGLEVRSDVKMRGIRVGSVSGFKFSPKQPGVVEVTIGIDPSAPILQSTRAVVDRNLITGLANIKLLNLDEKSAKLTQPPPGERDPVIAEGESQFEQVSQTFNGLAARADETMRRIEDVLSPANQAALAQTLDNLRLLSQTANGSLKQIEQTVASTARAADSVSRAADSFGGDVHRLAGRYDALGNEASTSMREITGSIGQLSGEVSRLANRADSILLDGNVELKLAGEELRTTADALATAARKLSEPRALVFGPNQGNLGPGERQR